MGTHAVAAAYRGELRQVKVREIDPKELPHSRPDRLDREGQSLAVYRPKLPAQAPAPPLHVPQRTAEPRKDLAGAGHVTPALVSSSDIHRTYMKSAQPNAVGTPTTVTRPAGSAPPRQAQGKAEMRSSSVATSPGRTDAAAAGLVPPGPATANVPTSHGSSTVKKTEGQADRGSSLLTSRTPIGLPKPVTGASPKAVENWPAAAAPSVKSVQSSPATSSPSRQQGGAELRRPTSIPPVPRNATPARQNVVPSAASAQSTGLSAGRLGTTRQELRRSDSVPSSSPQPPKYGNNPTQSSARNPGYSQPSPSMVSQPSASSQRQTTPASHARETSSVSLTSPVVTPSPQSSSIAQRAGPTIVTSAPRSAEPRWQSSAPSSLSAPKFNDHYRSPAASGPTIIPSRPASVPQTTYQPAPSFSSPSRPAAVQPPVMRSQPSSPPMMSSPPAARSQPAPSSPSGSGSRNRER